MTQLREKLLGSRRRVKPVAVPELDSDTTLYLGIWSGAERAAFLTWYADGSKRADLYGRVLAQSLCDADGLRLFKDDEADSVQSAIDGVVAERLTMEALRFNGITKTATDEAKNG